MPDRIRRQQAAGELDQRIARRNRRLACAAAPAQREPGHHGNVLERADPVAAAGACRARRPQVVDVGGRRRLAGELGALRAPIALEHLRQPVHDDVEKAADAQADEERDDGGRQRVSQEYRHRSSTQSHVKKTARRARRPRSAAHATGAWRRARGAVGGQITAPSLKIGRYIATTRPPITTPRNTMMIGSSRLDSAVTASSTSRS